MRYGPSALALGLALGCAPAPRRAAPPATADLPQRFAAEQIACDQAGNVYVVSLERFRDRTQVFFVASNDHGETWNRTFRYLNEAGDGWCAAPQMVVGADREIFVVWENGTVGSRGIRFTRSLDAGASWLPETRLDTYAGSRAVAPAIACDRWGRVHVVWLDDREGFEAFYANRSTDRGTTWQAVEARVTPLRIGRKSAPRLDCDDSGRVYVTWIERRDDRQSAFFTASHDGGATWDLEDHENSSGGRVTAHALGLLEDDGLLHAWREEDRGASLVAYRRSQDRGRSWDPSVSRFVTREPLVAASSPVLLVGAWGTAYVLWDAIATDGTPRVVLQHSRDGARRFEESALRPSEGPLPRAWPHEAGARRRFDAAADPSGNVYLVWLGATAQETRLEFYRAMESGARWLRNEVFVAPFGHEPAAHDTPKVCADDFGHVHLLWNEGHALHAASSPFFGDSGWRHAHF